MATLTYVYADQTAVVGALSPERVPGGYDLCASHCERLSPPRGWEVVRLNDLPVQPPAPNDDDLLALANAVREVGLRPDEVRPSPELVQQEADPGVIVLAERRHLRMLGPRDQH